MENEVIRLNGFSVNYRSTKTLIIGSGAAALNAAVSLHSMGEPDIIIATAGWGWGTSNNAGSDKQTYYKLSLAGDVPDSVTDLARDLFRGKCMHGDIALCEAQGSVRAFMNLVNMGVPFPHDKYGSYAGYKTDHDPRARATSAGPYTSKMMFRVLSEEVLRRKITILDRHYVISLLTDREKTRVVGALAVNILENDPVNAFTVFNASNIILGTGGPGDMYETSVYPESQTGSVGMAFKAGASGQNLTESQFGIASLKFRWNLSGSYQQVLPRYYSTAPDGSDPREFLNDFFPDYRSITRAIFLKGYQWPFDVRKISGYGSSLIDLLVFREREKGRRVFIDFMRNLTWDGCQAFKPEELDPEVYNYLAYSDSLKPLPLERLEALNSPAISLYMDHGIDIRAEALEIGICAQHCNGGLKGNIWWESDLRHLFPVGEVNGSHGVYRPGGSSLNSGQVGGHRAAFFITKRYQTPPPEKSVFLSETVPAIEKDFGRAADWLSGVYHGSTPEQAMKVIRKRMTDNGSILRSGAKIMKAVEEARIMYDDFDKLCAATSVKELAECFMGSNSCLAHLVYLEAIRTYIAGGGRSRGSFIVDETKESAGTDPGNDSQFPILCSYDRDIEEKIIEIRYDGEKINTNLAPVRMIPEQNLWFEKVWKEFREDIFLQD
ncbi:MAG TPA: FAD-binding protein [Bacteroidales bacterium]|nr:FAD-binding protein [Bacteroidales bacterium]HNR40887.1 FAD-binding protein [Bacteroidales bacterium]HPM17677.1 FAD-binding protein [Bacteroidales bacterium]